MALAPAEMAHTTILNLLCSEFDLRKMLAQVTRITKETGEVDLDWCSDQSRSSFPLEHNVLNHNTILRNQRKEKAKVDEEKCPNNTKNGLQRNRHDLGFAVGSSPFKFHVRSMNMPFVFRVHTMCMRSTLRYFYTSEHRQYKSLSLWLMDMRVLGLYPNKSPVNFRFQTLRVLLSDCTSGIQTVKKEN